MLDVPSMEGLGHIRRPRFDSNSSYRNSNANGACTLTSRPTPLHLKREMARSDACSKAGFEEDRTCASDISPFVAIVNSTITWPDMRFWRMAEAGYSNDFRICSAFEHSTPAIAGIGRDGADAGRPCAEAIVGAAPNATAKARRMNVRMWGAVERERWTYWGLTFDMSGGWKRAKHAGRRPLDGRVRPRSTDYWLA